jgi:hypothetical protein
MSYQSATLAGVYGPLRVTSVVPAVTTTVSSISLITLTQTSTQQQYITGSIAQTIRMPIETTLARGQTFTIINGSSAVITVQASNSATISTVFAGAALSFTLVNNSLLTPAAWTFNTTVSSITGTPNQIITSGTTGSIVLYTPQDIATDSNPTFNSMNLNAYLQYGEGIRIGDSNTVTASSDGIAIGKSAAALERDTIAIGNNITNEIRNSALIGTNAIKLALLEIPTEITQENTNDTNVKVHAAQCIITMRDAIRNGTNHKFIVYNQMVKSTSMIQLTVEGETGRFFFPIIGSISQVADGSFNVNIYNITSDDMDRPPRIHFNVYFVA